MIQPILFILPPNFRSQIEDALSSGTEEIRLRAGQAVHMVAANGEQAIGSQIVRAEDLQNILSAACGGSVYAVNDRLKEGFLTLPGGHRMGICGEAVTEHGSIRTIRNISSLSIRIAREYPGIGFAPKDSTLILGPPGSGKTTLLRDCIRLLSDVGGKRVSLVDERGEIAACTNGIAQFHIGRRTDVLAGCKKEQGIAMLLRSMNPQWIAVDEITKAEDVEALCRSSYCGVRLLATAHADSINDLRNRPVYRVMLEHRIFKQAALLQHNHIFRLEELL